MALYDFFRINLPYGIKRSEDGRRWAVHNREYSPLGLNDHGGYNAIDSSQSRLFVAYSKLTEKYLLKIAWHPEQGVIRNDQGELIHVFLYNDASNPMNESKEKSKLWQDYVSRLKLLAKLENAELNTRM